MRAFITGSRAYGKPGPKSDIDLVVMADDEAVAILQEHTEGERTVRFGRLNLILCFSETEFAAWRITTDRLKKLKVETGATFDKVAAHAQFEKDRQTVGVEYKGDSGEDYSPESFIDIPKTPTNISETPANLWDV